MSRFPRRLVDELGDGHARRLLQAARSDEPPAKIVAAAVLVASKTAQAGKSVPSRTSSAFSRQKSRLLVAGAVAVGTAAIALGATELRTTGPDPSRASASPTVAPAPSPASPTDPVESPRATSVADLPNAPPVLRPSVPKVAEANPSEQQADLLREANRLRARSLWTEAAATYLRVIDLGPESPEAYPAAVALGNLELQQNRPSAALARYDHALASHPNGALSEEARWGRARALRASGRVTEERAALREFRTRHPDSPLASAATQRLEEIGD
jgi:TolA-binding protein